MCFDSNGNPLAMTASAPQSFSAEPGNYDASGFGRGLGGSRNDKHEHRRQHGGPPGLLDQINGFSDAMRQWFNGGRVGDMPSLPFRSFTPSGGGSPSVDPSAPGASSYSAPTGGGGGGAPGGPSVDTGGGLSSIMGQAIMRSMSPRMTVVR